MFNASDNILPKPWPVSFRGYFMDKESVLLNCSLIKVELGLFAYQTSSIFKIIINWNAAFWSTKTIRLIGCALIDLNLIDLILFPLFGIAYLEVRHSTPISYQRRLIYCYDLHPFMTKLSNLLLFDGTGSVFIRTYFFSQISG
jgi:hypothetical protein